MRTVIEKILLALADAGGQLTHQEVTTRLLRRNYTQAQIRRMLDGELSGLVIIEERQIAGTSARVWKITNRGYEALGRIRRAVGNLSVTNLLFPL